MRQLRLGEPSERGCLLVLSKGTSHPPAIGYVAKGWISTF